MHRSHRDETSTPRPARGTMRSRIDRAFYGSVLKVLAARRALTVVWGIAGIAVVVTRGFGWDIVAWAAVPTLATIGILLSGQQHDARRMDGRLRDEMAAVDRGDREAQQRRRARPAADGARPPEADDGLVLPRRARRRAPPASREETSYRLAPPTT
jgi:hypothetical protein